MADAYRNGTFPADKWLAEAELVAIRQMVELRSTLKRSTKLTFCIGAVIALALAFLGKINPNLPVDSGKLVTVVGTLAAVWASILQFHPVTRTFRGNYIHEVAHDAAVRTFFVCGVILGSVGTLWS